MSQMYIIGDTHLDDFRKMKRIDFSKYALIMKSRNIDIYHSLDYIKEFVHPEFSLKFEVLLSGNIHSKGLFVECCHCRKSNTIPLLYIDMHLFHKSSYLIKHQCSGDKLDVPELDVWYAAIAVDPENKASMDFQSASIYISKNKVHYLNQ